MQCDYEAVAAHLLFNIIFDRTCLAQARLLCFVLTKHHAVRVRGRFYVFFQSYTGLRQVASSSVAKHHAEQLRGIGDAVLNSSVRNAVVATLW